MCANLALKDEQYKAMSPLSEPNAGKINMAPRLNTLEGKTVCEIWNGGFRGDISFPIIERILKEQYPTVKLVPYTKFSLVTIASLHPECKEKTLETVRDQLQKEGCEALITGNGG